MATNKKLEKVQNVFYVAAAIVGVIMGIIWLYRHFATPVSIGKPIDNSVNTACLYIQNNLTMMQFDGRKVRRYAGFGSRAIAVNVPEGTHALVFDYKETFFDTTTTAEGFELNIPFESGQYYFVNYKKEGSKIRVYWDQTEEGVYRERLK